MTPTEIEAYLHQHIPLSAAMAVAVASADTDEVVLSAPLEPNINHRETVFGGSATALAVLAAWTLVHLRLRAEDFASRLVIQRHSMDYEAPATGRFSARAALDEAVEWERFTRTLVRRGRARITLSATIEQEGTRVGRLAATFVAVEPEKR